MRIEGDRRRLPDVHPGERISADEYLRRAFEIDDRLVPSDVPQSAREASLGHDRRVRPGGLGDVVESVVLPEPNREI